MSIALACTWRPRGETRRFQRMLPQLRQAYDGIAVSLPPDANPEDRVLLQDLIGGSLAVTTDWSHGRHAAIRKALEQSCSHIHYADMDRLLHWVETGPGEWRSVIEAIRQTDCLIIGRTEQALQTHPQAIQQTECIINAIFSYLLGQPVDLGGGSRGFSRRAAVFLMAHSPPGRALGTDTEWPVLLHRAGFAVDFLAVDGLAWEIPDHHAAQAADSAMQRRAAETYDSDAERWAMRVRVALEIVQAGLSATQQVIE